ncbi:transglutaminaseTgpA domain-containing protein [Gynuella sp.]|uniref:transglutaminase family protein n=1 Tax=Gynuella sp. TaxID=2969146 RepID=UPI003D0B2BC5
MNVKPGQQSIHRASLIWLLLTQIAVAVSFLDDLPSWLFPMLIVTAGWRLWIVRGHWQKTGWQLKTLAISIGVTGVALSGVPPISLEAVNSLLMLAYLLKNLELSSRRDGMVVVYTGYFLVCTQFLYSQSILITLYSLVLLIVLTAGLISLQQTHSRPVREQLKLSLNMLGLCLPLMLVVYLLFPRLPALWSVPMPDSAKTGVSDEVTPGDIANLARSDELAFRATFQGNPPRASERYWRGIVLNYFDGKTWRQGREGDWARTSFRTRSSVPQDIEYGSRSLSYSVIYQTSYQPWLFTLTPSANISGDAVGLEDYRWVNRMPISAPTRFEFEAYPDAVIGKHLNRVERSRALMLPEDGNPQSREFARRQRALAGSDEAYVHNVARWFFQEQFYYTLQPPLLGDTDTIDRFLFESQAGFCAHFASAYTFLMRAVGIPARMVAGYQGGEWNADAKYIAVRQYDAHAWVEVWLEDKGWVRMDPTAYVAPNRVEQNLRSAISINDSQLMAGNFQNRFKWLNRLRQQMDAMQYAWQVWVLDFDMEDQSMMLSMILGDINVYKTVLFSVVVMVVIGTVWGWSLGLFTGRRKTNPYYLQLHQLIEMLLDRGISVSRGAGPGQLHDELNQQTFKGKQSVLDYLLALNQQLYTNEPDPQLRRKFRHARQALVKWKRFRRK